jgi:hypothetical protein
MCMLNICSFIYSGDVVPEDIPELFMNLSPFEMKTLLYHILSGKEFNVSRGEYNIFCTVYACIFARYILIVNFRLLRICSF